MTPSATVTKNMKIFLVAAVLCLTILAQAWGAPGQHFLLETEDAGDEYEEKGAVLPATGAGRWAKWWGGQARSNSNAQNKNNIQIG